MKDEKKKVVVSHNGQQKLLHASPGLSLLHLLHDNGYDIYAPCGGNGICGKCKVMLKDDGYVTACNYRIEEDIGVVLPDSREAGILAAQYEHSRVLPLSPGNFDQLSAYPVGVALDIGTTTIVLYFIHLYTGAVAETRSLLNPQGKYGADVISRIQYTMQHENGLEVLQGELIEAINAELTRFADHAGFGVDDIVKVDVAGNTTMLHLFLGEDTSSLASVPFTPVFTDYMRFSASLLSLKAHPDALVTLLPSLTAYIGADILAGLASLLPSGEGGNYLFIDIGTNGEMALVTPDRIYCCATAAGPAFEGANIEHGMGALQGAISSFKDSNQYRTIGNETPVGICGSGLIDIVASLKRSGLITEDGEISGDHTLVPPSDSGTGEAIVLTQQDVREVQLAKGAIAAGIRVMVKEAGLSYEAIDTLYLAGGFGNYIDSKSAIAIGLLPAEFRDRIVPVGNSSGTGAVLSVKSAEFEKVIHDIKRRMEYIELSGNDDFLLEFAMNMRFP